MVIDSRLTTRKIMFIALASIVLAVALSIFLSRRAEAASYAYPDCCSPNTYVTAARAGNGIFLDAPVAYMKAKYSSDSGIIQLNFEDACYWANVDGGSSRPGSCRSGDVNVTVCPSAPDGSRDPSYKTTGRCWSTDPTFWGGGTGNYLVSWNPAAFSAGNPVPNVGGFYNLYVIVTMNTPGSNAFKVTAIGGSNVRIGFAASGSSPMSLGNMPLSSVGVSNFQVSFKTPCVATSSFNLYWFDADRGAAGTPQDYSISWNLTNTAPGVPAPNVSADTLAFLSGQSLETYLGGQADSRNVPIGNSVLITVQQNQRFSWQWTNVRNNNGVQMAVPYDEADILEGCPPSGVACSPVSRTVGINQTANFTATGGASYSWSAPGGTPASGSGASFGVQYTTPGTRNVTVTSGASSATCTVTVTAPLGCPSMATALQTINLSPQNVPASSGVPPYGPAGSQYRTRTPNGYYRINSTNDQWGATTPWTPAGRATNSFTLNYRSHMDNYPYDYHNPNVRYDTYYNEQLYTASGPAVYGPPPIIGFGPPPTFTPIYGPAPYLGQAVVASGGPVERIAGGGSVTAPGGGIPELRPCYVRNFVLTPSTASAIFDDTENPANVTFSSAITAQFSVAQGGALRRPHGTNVPVTASYQVIRANGTTYSYPASRISATSTASGGGSCPFTGFSNPSVVIEGTTSNSSNVVCTYTERYSASRDPSGPLRAGDRSCFVITLGFSTGGSLPINNTTTSPVRLFTGPPPPTVVSTASPLYAGQITAAAPAPALTTANSTTHWRCSTHVVNQPYVAVFGGDVSAGGSFGQTACSGNGTVLGYYRSSTQAGSSAQYAVMAIGSITEFASAKMRNTTPQPLAGLSFANTSGGYGGNFGGQHCLGDYYARKPGSLASPSGSPPSGVLTTSDQTFHSGPATINGISLTPTGVKRTIYINGDLRITNNITYLGGAWANVNHIPSMYVIVRGNIYIDPAVTQLDGVYVAEPSGGSGGNIYTCSTGSGTVSAAQMYDQCSRPLQVNGAFIAQRVKLQRAGGSSLRYGLKAEFPYGANRSCEPLAPPLPGLPARPVCAAEIFNFGIETFLAEPQLPPTRSGLQGKYDYVTTLPPVL